MIFADLKKHLFTYQFYSTAVPVKNYQVKGWHKFNDLYQEEDKTKLTNFIREASQEKVFPQFVVLNR